MRSKYVALFFFIVLFPGVTSAYEVPLENLKVGFSLYGPPIFLIEEDRNNVMGLSVEFAEILARIMNLDLKKYVMDDAMLSEALNEGRIDLIIGIKDEIVSPETRRIIETKIEIVRRLFINRNYETINSIEKLTGHTVLVEDDNLLARIISTNSKIKYIEASAVEEALDILNSGGAQALLYYGNVINQGLLIERGFNNVKEVEEISISSPLVIAVNENNRELYMHLEKAYEKTVLNNGYNKLTQKWLNRDIEYPELTTNDIHYFFGKYSKSISLVMGGILSILLAIGIWNRTLKVKVRETTKNLRISEQKHKDLIDLSPDIIHLVSKNGQLRFSNKIGLRRLRYDKNEFTSIKMSDLIPGDQLDDFEEFLKTVFKKNYANGEFILKTKSGGTVNVEMVATVVNWDSDGEYLACCFSRDLTERKRLEENLIHSDRLAIMGQISAGIAHELNNPLGIILSHTQDVRHYDLKTAEINESFESIERNAIRASKIIKSLLSFTRPMPLDKAPFNVVQLIDESLLFLKPKIKQKRIRIEKIYLNDPVVFVGDKKLIQQLLINFILNSIQAIRKNGIITFRLSLNGESNGKWLILEVEDNGIGIPNEDKTKIFDPFFTARKEKGFGLGLYISKLIIEKHSGRIEVGSAVGGGTVMKVFFPMETKKESISV